MYLLLALRPSKRVKLNILGSYIVYGLKAAQLKPQNNIGDHLNSNQVFIAAGPKGHEKIENI